MSKINVCDNEHHHQLRRNRHIISIREQRRWSNDRDRQSIYEFVQTTGWCEQLLPNRRKVQEDERYFEWVSDHAPCYQTLTLAPNTNTNTNTKLRCITWNVLTKDLENDSYCYCLKESESNTNTNMGRVAAHHAQHSRNNRATIREFALPRDKDFFDKRIPSICHRVKRWVAGTNRKTHTLITLVEMDSRTARAVDDMLNALKTEKGTVFYRHHTEHFATAKKYGTYIIWLSGEWSCTPASHPALPSRCDMFTLRSATEGMRDVCRLCTVHLASGSDSVDMRRRTKQLNTIIREMKGNPRVPLIIAGDRNCGIADFTRDVVAAQCTVDTPHASDQTFAVDCGYPLTTFRIRGGETDQAMKMFEVFTCQMMACVSVVVRAGGGGGSGGSDDHSGGSDDHSDLRWRRALQQPQPKNGLGRDYPYPVVPLHKDVLVGAEKFGRFAKRLQKYLQAAKLPDGKGVNIQEKLDILRRYQRA